MTAPHFDDTLTLEQAQRLAQSEFWKSMTAKEIAEFQLYTERLCMPFSVFHKAIEEALGRSVWTHEFGMPMAVEGMRKELRGEKPAPSFAEIMALLPAEKLLVVKL